MSELIDYNPNIDCDVCEGTGEPSTKLFPNASRCWYCQGTKLLPMCKICGKNGVWSSASTCNQCEAEPWDAEIDLTLSLYRSHITKEIVEQIAINPDRSIEIFYRSNLSNVTTYQYKQITQPSEQQLRYFIESFPESSAEKFNEVKKSLSTLL